LILFHSCGCARGTGADMSGTGHGMGHDLDETGSGIEDQITAEPGHADGVGEVG